jgi:hypothetical protein
MINNAATYLLLQNGIHSDMQMTPIQTLLVGGPLLGILLVFAIGFIADALFDSYKAFDICLKIIAVLLLFTVIGFIVSLFV